MAQPEALFQFADLGGDGGRIGGVSLKHLDCDRAAICRAQQTDHQLRPITMVVPAVAVAGQRTAASLQVSGGDVVQHQCAVLEVAAGELVFDEVLFAAEPVEGGVDLACSDAAEAEGFTERVAAVPVSSIRAVARLAA